MKFGVREICDVVLRAKSAMRIGEKVFYKNEPVLYFDSLKTSSIEGAATTVYAQGGRSNARLIAWEGERTVTFTMEDALLSPTGLAILTGAGLVAATREKPIIQHVTEQTADVTVDIVESKVEKVNITIKKKPYMDTGLFSLHPDQLTTHTQETKTNDYIYVMLLDENGEVTSEPFIASEINPATYENQLVENEDGTGWTITLNAKDPLFSDDKKRANDLSDFYNGCTVLVDYYTAHIGGHVYQADITPEMFGGNFYLEASTLFRDANGVDMPAEFIIPNCKVQSNFTFTMASSGDPSTFTFTMDAFPDYTRWDKTKKVFASLQIIGIGEDTSQFERFGTPHSNSATTVTVPDGGPGVGGVIDATTAKEAFDAEQANILGNL